MTRVKLEVGSRISQEGRRYVVLDIDHNENVILENIEDGRRTSKKRRVLQKELLLGGACFIDLESDPELVGGCPFDLLSEEMKVLARRREAYTRALAEKAIDGSVRSAIPYVRETVAEELKDHSPPSNSSLMRWLNTWRSSGGDVISLVPDFNKRGQQTLKTHSRVVEIVEEVVRCRFWRLEKPHLKAILGDIADAIWAENKKRARSEQLSAPSYATVRRIEAAMDPYERMVARDGKAAAERYFKPVLTKLKVEAPLDLVQIDHTILDIHVLAPVEGWVARPRITVAMDTYSRMPVGIYLGFVSAGYESVMLCLKQAIEPKDGVLEQFKDVKALLAL